MDSFEPHNSLSRPRGWPATSKGNRGHQGVLPIGVPRHICTPITSWAVKEEVSAVLVPPVSDLPVPPTPSSSLSIPNFALSTAWSLPGPPVPLSSHYSLSLSFSQPSFSKGLSTLAVFLPHLQFPLQPTAS